MPGTDKPSLFAAIAMIVIGLLILLPSGLCTGIGLFAFFSEASRGNINSMAGVAATFLYIAVPFVMVGGLLVWLGIRLIRRRASPKSDPGAF